ncbi:hypothetical protein EWM64_g6759 [Hericium alpestre]|uniref:MYND-type domain-containing protein n=1 Tax=Hericium alpestre TaxID=135208 RepID=A0A4Y9ZSL2_9AGAM|nr:hypothetical protein EWM64_g6759 [Hericium alpestre]
MPILDSTVKFAVGDPKAEKVCAWPHCPAGSSKMRKTKMRVCSRCHFVRYCSKACQSADWPDHKVWCRPKAWYDIGAWISSYEWLFKWAAEQVFNELNGVSPTTHCLVVAVRRTDNLPKRMSVPFLLLGARVEPIEEYDESAREANLVRLGGTSAPRNTRPLYGDEERAESAEIRRLGGLGLVLMVFRCEGMPRGGSIFIFRRWALHGVGGGYLAGWQSVVKDVVYGHPRIRETLEAVSGDAIGE